MIVDRVNTFGLLHLQPWPGRDTGIKCACLFLRNQVIMKDSCDPDILAFAATAPSAALWRRHLKDMPNPTYITD